MKTKAPAFPARETAPCGTCARPVLLSASVQVRGVHYHPMGGCAEKGIHKLRAQLSLALDGVKR